MIKKGHVYLIQPEEYLDTNIYKIGYTTEISVRIKSYGRNTKLLDSCEVENPQSVEQKLLNVFNRSFKRVKGEEYFQGEEDKIKHAFFINTYMYKNVNYFDSNSNVL